MTDNIKEMVIAVLKELKEASVSQIVAALKKDHALQVKSHDINPILYRENGSTFHMNKADKVPRWSLKAGTTSPTLSCALMFATISPKCEHPERLIDAIVQALSIEGVSTLTCYGETPNGRLAASIAADYGLTVNLQGAPKEAAEQKEEATPNEGDATPNEGDAATTAAATGADPTQEETPTIEPESVVEETKVKRVLGKGMSHPTKMSAEIKAHADYGKLSAGAVKQGQKIERGTVVVGTVPKTVPKKSPVKTAAKKASKDG